ncbi:MAG TPA: Ig-like domain-containing protein [Planctomycetota bacterium]|nr:Ig-like domain-containing protein [Planctomycetota bacterium]
MSTTDRTPTVTGTISHPMATVSVVVNGVTYTGTNAGNGTWSANVTTNLADGTYNVVATATRNGLNATGNNQLIVDTTKPVVTVNSLNTSNTTPTITGTVTDTTGTIVSIVVNGRTYSATVTGNSWSAVVTHSLAIGTYNVAATAVDAVGNTGSDSTTNELTISPPLAITVNNQITSNQTPVVGGNVNNAGASISVQVNGFTYAGVNNGNGTWSATITNALAEGVFDVKATVSSGMDSATDNTSNELTIDVTKPAVTVNTLATSDTMPTITGTVTDASAPSVSIVVNGNTYIASVVGQTWSASVTSALAEGAYDVIATATDSAGNTANDSTNNELTIDLTNPAVTVTVLTTANASFTITGTVTDATAASVSVLVNGQTYAATVTGNTWSAAISATLAEGIYEVVATATDAAGNTANDTTSNELTIDKTKPVVTVTALTSKDTTPTLTGTVTDATSASVSIVVNGQTYSAVVTGNSWSADVSNALNEGTYDVQATAIDAAGNTANDNTTNELTIDLTAPTITVTGFATASTKPTINGTVTDATATTVVVVVNGQTYNATVTGGTWSVEVTDALSEGAYEITATATDAAGNTASDTSSKVTIDQTKPVVSVNTLKTADTTPTLTGTVTDATASSVTIQVNGKSYLATVTGNSWSANVTDELQDGVYNVSATATDAAGNTANDDTNNELTINTTALAISVNTLFTANQSPTIGGTVNDATATISVDVGGATYAGQNNGNGTWSATITAVLDEGVYEVAAAAANGVTTASDATNNELTIDLTKPAVTVAALRTANTSPTITGTVSDATATTVSIIVNGQTYAATVTGNTWSAAITATLAEGIYEVAATATDASGNTAGDTTNNELTIDKTKPVVTVTALTSKDTTPSITGTVTDATAASVSIVVNGQTYSAVVTGNSWSAEVTSALIEGTYDVQATAIDAAGNSASDNTTNELTIDLTVPVIAVNTLLTNNTSPTVTGTIDDSKAAITVVVSGVTYTGVNNGNGNWSAIVTGTLEGGVYDVAATATDVAGSSANDATIDELKIDLTVPTITVSRLVTNDQTPTLTGTVNDPQAALSITVNGATYVGVNAGDGIWSATVTNSLAAGIYDVTATATDAAGNAGQDGTIDELTIDLSPPDVTVVTVSTSTSPAVLTGTTNDSAATIVVRVNGIDYTATNHGDGTWSVTIPNLPDNTYDVIVRATDVAGNAAVLTVPGALTVDTQPPTFTSRITANPNPAFVGQTVTFSAPASDAQAITWHWDFSDGIKTDTNSGSTSHVFGNPGRYLVNVTVRDAGGLQTDRSVEVTVVVAAVSQSDFDQDGIPDDKDPDDDNDSFTDVDETDGGSDPFDPNSVPKTPMVITKVSARAAFSASGKDSYTISGILTNMPKTFSALGKEVVVDFGGANGTFKLDGKGRGKSAMGQLRLKLKLKRNKAAKLKEFVGGPVQFQVKLKGDLRTNWTDEGVDPTKDKKRVMLPIVTDLKMGGVVYTDKVNSTYSSKAQKTGAFKFSRKLRR